MQNTYFEMNEEIAYLVRLINNTNNKFAIFILRLHLIVTIVWKHNVVLLDHAKKTLLYRIVKLH